MAKRVQVSINGGTTYFTLPGGKADMSRQTGDIKDTIFGQNFASSQPGLIGWSISADGLYKGFAGYVAKLMKSGTPTIMTAEPMSLVSGKLYKTTNIVKNMWDRATALTVLDNAVAVSAANILSIDWLFGRVTFVPAYTPTGPITVTGKYLPTTQIAGANAFTLTQQTVNIDNSEFITVQANGGYRTADDGLQTVKLSLKGIYKVSAGFEALLAARAECVVEIGPDGSNLSVARGFFKPMETGQSGSVGELESATLDFTLSVPDQANVITPFAWLHDSTTTLNTALKNCLDTWISTDYSAFKVNYLADGVNGYQGLAVITDITLEGGLEVMNSFNIKFQGNGALAVYP